ncbi:MAG: hypothetical protein HYY76_16680 [Acidobacteria bacterium]|nr:hypothetical protein [Acidobacteriota bacterium]
MRVLPLTLLVCAAAIGCGGAFKPEYEYEEELYLALDGSATLNVYASVASLVALRGAALDPDPRARIDLDEVRAFFGAPAVPVSVSLSRRDGRRFVNVSVQVDDVRELARIAPFAWSSYRLDRRGDVLEFRQIVGPPARVAADGAWTGGELVAFRIHLPSEIVFHNAPSGEIERGNIVVWEQPLGDRLAGRPVEIQVNLEPTSILVRTLLLFGATILGALAALAAVIWWISRRGRETPTAAPAPR